MASIRQDHLQRSLVSRISRPNLTLNTQPSVSSNPHYINDGPSAYSAPVGTRQEKGEVPMYQTGDRHIAKLAEMMDSPTWRRQNPGPHVHNDVPALGCHYSLSSFGDDENTQYKYQQNTKKNAFHTSKVPGPGQSLQGHLNIQPAPDVIRLSLGADDIKVQGVHAFPKLPEISDNTFLISATVSQQRRNEKTRATCIDEEQDAEKECRSDSDDAVYNSPVSAASCDALGYDRREKQQSCFPGGAQKLGQEQSKQRFPCGALGNGQEMEKTGFPVGTRKMGGDLEKNRPPTGALRLGQDKGHKHKDGAKKVTEREDAIQPINHNQLSSSHHGQAASDAQQRFDNLLNRLHGRDRGDAPKQPVPLTDPAIVAFAPKKSGSSIRTEAGTRCSDDSGYSGPASHSRSSTCVQSSLSGNASVSTAPEPVQADHGKGASHHPGFDDSLSKKPTLNPTAREFALPSTSNTFPPKQGDLAWSTVFGNDTPAMQSVQAGPLGIGHPALPTLPQPFQGMLTALSQPQMGPMLPSQEAWFPPQLPQAPQAVNNPPMTLSLMQQQAIQQQAMQQRAMQQQAVQQQAVQQQLMQHMQQRALPGMYLPGAMPSATSFKPMDANPLALNAAGSNNMSGPAPAMSQLSEISLAGFGTLPGPLPTSMPSPFHQQLPALARCNNPSHQALAPLVPASQSGPIAPVTAPQIPGPVASLSALTASAAPFAPQHVPKPKVPNTTGQQNWELMHELRRMNEPGYAQKCKEKQKKRYLKQLEKAGSQS